MSQMTAEGTVNGGADASTHTLRRPDKFDRQVANTVDNRIVSAIIFFVLWYRKVIINLCSYNNNNKTSLYARNLLRHGSHSLTSK